MRGVAARHRPDELHRDPLVIGDGQVLAGRDVELGRRQRLIDVVGPHEPHRCRQRGVVGAERSPGQRRHMAGGRDRGKVEVPPGQDRTVFRPAQRDRHRRPIGDVDDRGPGFQRFPPIGRQHLFRIVGVQTFDEHILIVEIGRGHPPAEPVASADDHRRHAGDRGPDHAAALQLKPRQIPDGRGREPQMRVIGQKRAARGRPVGCCRPDIRGARQPARGHRPEVGTGARRPCQRMLAVEVGKERSVIGQGGDTVARNIRKQVLQPLFGQGQRHAGAQHLLRKMARQPQRHQLDDGQAVGRLPGRDGRLEDPELGRPASACALVHLEKPGVDPVGIGAKGRLGIGVLVVDRLHGGAIKVEPPQKIVGFERALAEKLAQPPLRGPPQQQHLPHPVLRMGNAEAEKDVAVVLGEDMRHIGVVAHDLDRGLEARHHERLVVIGNRPCGEPEQDRPRGGCKHDRKGGETQKPAKKRCHDCLC